MIVSVSAIRSELSVGFGLVSGRWDGVTRQPVPPVGPARQILEAAPLAAERTPALVNRARATQDAQRSLAHPTYSTSGESSDRNPDARDVLESRRATTVLYRTRGRPGEG